jgi:hypothetical protein
LDGELSSAEKPLRLGTNERSDWTNHWTARLV